MTSHPTPAPSFPIEITRDSAAPLYRQLSRVLAVQIRSGARPVTSPLPSTRALALELGVSRNTVSAAYAELLAQGLIDGHPRRGFFINAEILQSTAQSGMSAAVGTPRTTQVHDGAPEIEGAHRVRSAGEARVPEIRKFSGWRQLPYPFVVGQIDEREFPKLAWARALRGALEPPHLSFSVGDAVDQDDPRLVAAILDYVLPSRGVSAEPANVLLTAGSQQGLDLIADALAGPGVRVGVEEPGYVDARHTFLRAGATLRHFPVDGDGVRIPAGPLGVDLFYLTPSHHSPTNVTLSRTRRVELIRRARDEGVFLIEDDYDSEFRYRGQPTPALRAHADHVLYLGSFTKFLAPGLRLGFVVADAALIRELRRVRRYRLRHLPGHGQRAMALFLEAGHYQRTVLRRRRTLSAKWTALRNALREELPWNLTIPPGGVSVWVTGPRTFDGVALTERVRQHGVVIEPGDVFFREPEQHRNHFRLGFAAIDLARIVPGVRELARWIRVDGAGG